MQQSLFDFGPPSLTVSQITRHIRQLFEVDDILQDIWLEGEISEWKQAASGHIYFTLKDAEAIIRCVIWRSSAQRLRHRPQGSGEAVLAHGRVSVYEASGNYQFYVDAIEPAGLGALYAQFERLKAMLAEEGLFEADRKRPLPAFPQRIGIVTSAQAAALQDVLNVMRRRYPLAEVILSPTPVQGADAPPQIVAAFNRLAAFEPSVDVILLVRGGGSIEDLWAFNDETLARTVAASPIPVVTGVGHETDFTIVDFVADQRAPTPSAAAELVTPDVESIVHQLQLDQGRLSGLALARIQAARFEVREQVGYLRRLSPQRQIDARRQQIDDMVTTCHRLMSHLFTLRRAQLASAEARLKTLNPKATLARGYAIIQKGGQLVTGVQDVTTGDTITVTMQDGDFEATVR